MMLERGLHVDHTTIYRWVQRYAPELSKRCRPHLKATNDSWRVDETSIKVKKQWVYLSEQLIQKEMHVISFSAQHEMRTQRSSSSSKRLLPLILRSLVLRQVKYLNNLIEQDHRFVKRLTKPGMGFFSFETAWRILQGFEMMNMIRKGQMYGVAKGDVGGQIALVARLFGIVA